MPAGRRVFPDKTSVVALLLALFAAQGLFAMRGKSPVFDEPAHIGAGLSYLKTGEFKVNLQHPPLLKEIAALPLLAIGARLPIAPEAWASLRPDRQGGWFQWQLGNDTIFENGADRVMFWSRLPFLGLAVLLGGLLYAWGRRLLGGAAAVGALFLYALDPNVVAHSYLVTMDVGFAAFSILFLFVLWRYLNGRTALRLFGCGLALGAVLSTKFSAVFLVPVAAVLLLWATRWIPEAAPVRSSSLGDPYASGSGAQRIVWCLYAILAMGIVAALVIHALYFLPGNPFLYLQGLRRVNADHDPSYLAFMAGRFQPRFLTYYVVAALLKEPIALLALAGIGLRVLLRRGASASMDRAFLLLPPAVIVGAHSLFSHNLGIRYIIPALPFLHLLGGAGLAHLTREGRTAGRVLAAVLGIGMVLPAAGIYPDHLSYFNEAACLLASPSKIGLDGGTACGPEWLDDSNVDWGQGLKELKAWIDRNARGRSVRLAYFGSVRPENYGIAAERVTLDDLLLRPPVPGLTILSAHYVARGGALPQRQPGGGPGSWIRSRPPVAIVGHAFYVYDLPGDTPQGPPE